MNRYKIVVSQNGWEYSGDVFITCNRLCKINKFTALINEEVKIEFDEEFYIDSSLKEEEKWKIIEEMKKS